jgi:hypothetical protein
MRGLVRCLAGAGVFAGSAMLATGQIEAAPLSAPNAMQAALADLVVIQPVQFIHHGKPYCWYRYGWAGPGWYWCGYGTRAGLGWGGAYGWNGWVAPRSSRALRHAPNARFRRSL